MISSNMFNNGERSPKGITPCSPQVKRKNIDLTLLSPMPTPTCSNQYSRKQVSNGALSPPNHYYPQKTQAKSIDVSTERDYTLQSMVRELSDRVIKLSQKIGQHEAILIKMTENSIQNNKEGYKRSGQGMADFGKVADPIIENVNRLRKDFEDYRNGNMANREIEVKNQLFSELIHKSEERMREQMQAVLRRVNEATLKSGSSFSDDRLQQFQKAIKKMQKGIALNSGKISGAYQKIEAISSSIDGHMDLVNAEVNKAISKIVGFVNEKVSKPITENIDRLTTRLDSLETEIKISAHQVSHFGGLKSSTLKSNKEITRADYRESLSAYGSEIIISESTYYIDREGYLLDRQFYYLVDSNEQRIRLDERQIQKLMSSRMLD